MKKAILTILCATSTMIVSAQDMNSKRGTPILPEAKDWSIGVDATPFLDYAGNLFSQYGNSAPSWGYYPDNNGMHPLTIVGLCVKDENTAYRGKIRIGFRSYSQDNLVDNNFTNDPNDQYTDTYKESSFNITLGAGMQKWRGKGRLKGLYGAEVLLNFGSGLKKTYEYGIALGDTLAQGPRPTEDKSGSNFGVGVRGFIGAEYFFAPKISVSGEFGWGIGISSSGEGELTTEKWDVPFGSTTGVEQVVTVTKKTGSSSTFLIDTDNWDGALVLHFYF